MKNRSLLLLVIPFLFMAYQNPASTHMYKIDTEFTTFRDSTKKWRQLFNGKDLSGWKHVGNGHMSVEEGIIKTHGGMGLL